MSSPNLHTPIAGPLSGNLLADYVGYFAARLLHHYPKDPFLRETAERAIGIPLHLTTPHRQAVAEFGRALDEAHRYPPHDRHPISVVTRAFSLSAFELNLMLLALLPEVDERFGDIYQQINREAGNGGRRLSVARALQLLLPADLERGSVRQYLQGSRLWSVRLLRTAPGDGLSIPVYERLLVATPALAAGVFGRLPERLENGAAVSLRRPADSENLAPCLLLRSSLAQAAITLAEWVSTMTASVVHLPCDDAEVGRLFTDAVLYYFGEGREVGAIHLQTSGADLGDVLAEASVAGLLTSSVLLLELDDSINEVRFPDGWQPRGLTLLLTPSRCRVELPLSVAARRVIPPAPTPLEQAAIWESYLDGAGAEGAVNVLANQTYLRIDQISRAVALARAVAKNQCRETIERRDLVAALAEVVPDPSVALAETRRPLVRWSELVLDQPTKTSLEDVVRRMQGRVTVRDCWGLKGYGGRGDGLVVLLHGESGTGKTLAAEAIAGQICLPMLCVDLSRVVSKYIGDTERNLDEVFRAAEGFRALLFCDEADALCGKRTAVRDAHDHYANIQSNFLLQRLERFEGVAVLATNLLKNIDEAFTRRLQFSIHLPRPAPWQQLAIWRQHLPAGQLGRDVNLEALVTHFDLVGGEVRNAALTAAYGAAARNGVIGQALLLDAIRQELAKKGRPMPVSLRRSVHA